jgi:hypothetical protein
MKKETKKKTKAFLKNVWTGVKGTYKEGERAVNYYGPKVHSSTGRMAENVEGLFTTHPTGHDIDFSVKSRHRVNMVNKPRRNDIDWNNLGMRY